MRIRFADRPLYLAWRRVLIVLLSVQLRPEAVCAQSATVTAIKSILSSPGQYDGATVILKGKVKAINYTPDIRDGVSLLSFELDDSTGTIRVLNQTAAMLSRGDRVQVTGTFRHLSSMQGITKVTDEVDSTRGEIEVIQGRRPDEIEKIAEGRAPDAVPTTVIDTPWSITVGVASLLSAVFAAIATLPLLLHSRRFNVGLVITEASPRETSKIDAQNSLFCLTLRLISTKAMTPQVAHSIELRTGTRSFYPRAVRVLPSKETPFFPIAVKDDVVIRSEYQIPSSVGEELAEGCAVILRDAFCRKKFVTRFGRSDGRDMAVLAAPHSAAERAAEFEPENREDSKSQPPLSLPARESQPRRRVSSKSKDRP